MGSVEMECGCDSAQSKEGRLVEGPGDQFVAGQVHVQQMGGMMCMV
ncbi:MAG: hypothetical protein AAF497_13225 [Planctomycetota bacterium]